MRGWYLWDRVGGTLERMGTDPRSATTVATTRSDTEVDAALQAGREFGEVFAFERELGRGAMGQVVAARDRTLGRVVAIKVLHPTLQRNGAALRRFLTEAQVGAQLEHPNIVPVYALANSAGAPAFAMRLLQGRSLAAFLAHCRACEAPGRAGGAESGREDLSLAGRLELFLAVLDAVAYAHARGVVHRDLKPDNIVLGAHHDVYLVDWGIAKIIGEPELEPIPHSDASESGEGNSAHRSGSRIHVSTPAGTTYGDLIGTPLYMPPEQAQGEIDAQGPACDQFALGMIVQEVASLAPPREGDSATAALAHALAGGRVPFTRLGDGQPVPAALAAIVARATAPAPEDRYPSVEELAADVRRFLRGEEVSVHRDPMVTRVWKRLSRRPGRALAVLATAIALAALAVSASLWRALQAEERARKQFNGLSALSGAVVGRAQELNHRLADVRGLVEGLGAATEELLNGSAASQEPAGWGAAGRLVASEPRLSGLVPSARYGMPTTFDMVAFVWPPDVAKADVLPEWRRLDPLRTLLPRTMAASDPGFDVPPDRAAISGFLSRVRPPIHVVYIGLSSGLLLNYPGYEPFPQEYDPRRRPWYQTGRTKYRAGFGTPYPDASGSAILVPCNRAVRAPDGTLRGVVGADMALDDVARSLRFADLAGWRRSELVDAHQRAILSTTQIGRRLGVGLHDDAALEGEAIDSVLARALTGRTHWVRIGDELVVFDALEEIAWTLVARFDARPYLDR